jgi:uncharacterized protein DUF3305
MRRVLSVALGVVIARDKIDHPWQEYAWRPVSVFLNAPEVSEWRELRRDATSMHYHAATLPLELHAKDTLGYVANLNEDEPSVYVVLREGGEHDRPVHVAIVTASPHEAEAYGQISEEIVGTVAMPQPLLDLMEAFVAEHHTEEPFVKRQRQKHHQAEEHKFGQEPIDVLRKRQPGAGENE